METINAGVYAATDGGGIFTGGGQAQKGTGSLFERKVRKPPPKIPQLKRLLHYATLNYRGIARCSRLDATNGQTNVCFEKVYSSPPSTGDERGGGGCEGGKWASIVPIVRGNYRVLIL